MNQLLTLIAGRAGFDYETLREASSPKEEDEAKPKLDALP
jgi:hypothetical protein